MPELGRLELYSLTRHGHHARINSINRRHHHHCPNSLGQAPSNQIYKSCGIACVSVTFGPAAGIGAWSKAIYMVCTEVTANQKGHPSTCIDGHIKFPSDCAIPIL